MFFVNLTPIYPLDGYRILFNLLLIFFDKLYVFDCLFYLSLLLEIFLIIIFYFFRLYLLIFLILLLIFKLLKNRKEERNKINICTLLELLK